MKRESNHIKSDQKSGRLKKLVVRSCIGAGSILLAAGIFTGVSRNTDWYAARKGTVPASVRVTNYEEDFEYSDMGEGAVAMQCVYRLVGTYDNNSGGKSVIVLNESYPQARSDDESAVTAYNQIGEQRKVYLDKSTFGAAGIHEVSVPDFDKSFLPMLIAGFVVCAAGFGMSIFTRISHRLQEKNVNNQ